MTRAEFMEALRTRLGALPAEEMDAALRYYEEYLDEAENENEAIEKLGSPEQIAARILADVERQDAAAVMQPAVTAKKEETKPAEKPEKKKRDPWTVVGLVVLCVCASPLLIAFGAAALAIAIALLAVLLSAIVAVIAPFLAMSIAFIALFFVLMYCAGALVGVFTPGAILLCGLAMVFGALGIACSIFTGYLFKWTGSLLKMMFRAMNFRKKGAEVK